MFYINSILIEFDIKYTCIFIQSFNLKKSDLG